MTVPVVRPGVRALLVDQADRVLLFSSVDEADGRVFWYPVGGGLKAGESPEGALRREVREETGLADVDIGPEVMRRRAIASWGGRTYDCRERIYLCRTPGFTVDTSGFTEAEKSSVAGHRWWTLDELDASDARLVPADLAARLRVILMYGAPDEPVAVGV